MAKDSVQKKCAWPGKRTDTGSEVDQRVATVYIVWMRCLSGSASGTIASLQRQMRIPLSTPGLLLMTAKLSNSFSTTGLRFRIPEPVVRWASTTDQSQQAWKDDNSEEDLDDLMETAQLAARAAGEIIRDNVGCSSELGCSVDGQGFEVKTTIKDIVTQYDQRAQEAVEGIIRSAYPEHSFLGEEDVAPGALASEEALINALDNTQSGFVWICDPIDGTANFASGLNLCAVTISLVYKGTSIVGVIYDPHSDEMFSAIRGEGAYLNNDRPLQVASSITRVQDAIINAGCPADPNAFEVSTRGIMALNSECRGIRMIACSALTTAWIADGRLAAHFGYDLSSWDLVAGALLIHEAGGLVTDLDGSEYQVKTRNMLCSNGVIHENVLGVLKSAGAVKFERTSV